MNDFIPVNEPLLNGNEKEYLIRCIETGWISSEGPFVAEFEEAFSSRVDREHAISVMNGSAALYAAIESLGVGPGDEVILPSFTIISCVIPIVRLGATPVLVDSDPWSWNMDVGLIEEKITPRTKVIQVVHIFGLPVDIDPVLRLAEKYGLKVIEDAAEMHGQSYKGTPCGSFGDISTFSFYANKLITTGEGGMIVTNAEHLANECRSLRNLCFQSGKRFEHERLGWNMRMTNMQAAIGLAQLERMDEFVDRKRRMGTLYTNLLSDLQCIHLPLARTDFADNIYWIYGLVLEEDVDFLVNDMMKCLAAKGIGTRPFFCPMHWQPALKKMNLFSGEEYPVAEKLRRRGFYLPSGMALSEAQIERVVDALISVLKERGLN